MMAMNGTTYGVTLRKSKLEEYKIGRGKWNLTVKQKLEQTFNAPDAKPVSVQNLVPECDPNYVPFGSFTDVKRIIKSGIFYPIFVTGLSGNGKTLSIEASMCSTRT